MDSCPEGSRPSAGAPQSTKVAIPRLEQSQKRPPPSNKSSAAKIRTSKACESCRKRKVKCTGGFPCRYCEEQNLDCAYQQGRRDRLKDATHHNVQLIALLRNLSLGGSLGEADQDRVDDLLNSIADDIDTSAKTFDVQPPASDSHTPSEEFYGEALVSGSVGSNEDADRLHEDLLDSHESRATGLVGQNSEIQWLHKLKQHTSGSSSKTPIAELTFYMDEKNLEPDFDIDADVMPQPETIERLFHAYKTSIHDAFPILPDTFEQQFLDYVQAAKREQPFRLSQKAQAVLNLVMAIGARYSHLIQASWREDERDHLVYVNRAIKLLGGKSTSSIIVSAPDLTLIQATGLLSLYYVVIGHVSRAWVIIGISIRYAFAVGMHLRNDDPSLPSQKRDAVTRSWWSLHSIECLLSSMIGRPCVISNEHCSVGLPAPTPGAKGPASPVPFNGHRTDIARSDPLASTYIKPYSSFFEARIHIGVITQKAQTLLYSPRVQTQSWEIIEKTIISLTNGLNHWAKSTFPHGAVLSAEFVQGAEHAEYFREHYTLAFIYYSTEILISRPCLCLLAERIKDQSVHSDEFNQKIGQFCVRAARDIAQLFPDQPDPAWIYRYGPWWCIVHNIMQAATIFLLDLSNDSLHSRNTEFHCASLLKKLVLWLRAMRLNNDVANKAYNIMLGMIKTCAPRNAEIADIFKDDEQELQVFLETCPKRLPPQVFDTSQWQLQPPVLVDGPLFHSSSDSQQRVGGPSIDNVFSTGGPSNAPENRHLSRSRHPDMTEYGQARSRAFGHFDQQPQSAPFEHMIRPTSSGHFDPTGIPYSSTQYSSSQPSLYLSALPSEQTLSTNSQPWLPENNPLYVPAFETAMEKEWRSAYEQPDPRESFHALQNQAETQHNMQPGMIQSMTPYGEIQEPLHGQKRGRP